MGSRGDRGFTLIELLTVIAVIMILVGLVSLGLSRAVERAKMASEGQTMNQIRNSMALYFTGNHETFPPRYGYLAKPLPAGTGLSNINGTDAMFEYFCMQPFTTYIGAFRNLDMYDGFSEFQDTNVDEWLQMLEYSPLGNKQGVDSYTFENRLYDASDPAFRGMGEPTGKQLTEQRPYVYLPVNLAQAKKVAEYYYDRLRATDHDEQLDGAFARGWDPNNPKLQNLRFPPRYYDGFALVGVGPMRHTAGIIPREVSIGSTIPSSHQYHINALRAFYLASRDLNDNMRYDFDFRNRSGSSTEDADIGTYPPEFPRESALLPVQLDPQPADRAYVAALRGPLLFVYPPPVRRQGTP